MEIQAAHRLFLDRDGVVCGHSVTLAATIIPLGLSVPPSAPPKPRGQPTAERHPTCWHPGWIYAAAQVSALAAGVARR